MPRRYSNSHRRHIVDRSNRLAELLGFRIPTHANASNERACDASSMKVVQAVFSFGHGGDLRGKIIKLGTLGRDISRSLTRSKTQFAELVLTSLQIAIRPDESRAGVWNVEPHLHAGFLVPRWFGRQERESLRCYLKKRIAGATVHFSSHEVKTPKHARNWTRYVHEYPIQCYRDRRAYVALEKAVEAGFRGLESVVDVLHTPADATTRKRKLRQLITTYGAMSARANGAQVRWASTPSSPEEPCMTEAQAASETDYEKAQREADELATGVAGESMVHTPASAEPKQTQHPARERVLCWKKTWSSLLKREVWMVIVRDPESADFRALLHRLSLKILHARQARDALAELDEAETKIMHRWPAAAA